MLKILSRLDTHPSEQRELHEAFTAINQELLEHPNEAKWSLPQWSRWLDENGFSSQLINQGIHQLFESAGEATALQSIEQALKAKESSTLAEALEISSQSHNQLVDELIEELAQHSQEIEDISATAGGTFKHPEAAKIGFGALAGGLTGAAIYGLAKGKIGRQQIEQEEQLAYEYAPQSGPNEGRPRADAFVSDHPLIENHESDDPDDPDAAAGEGRPRADAFVSDHPLIENHESDDPNAPDAAGEGRNTRADGIASRTDLDGLEQDVEQAFRDNNLNPEDVERYEVRHESAESEFLDSHGSHDSLFDNLDTERIDGGVNSQLEKLRADLDELGFGERSGLKNEISESGIGNDVDSKLKSGVDGLASKTETEIINAEESAATKLDDAAADADNLVDM